jgi:BirA family biotin operon repressor/biotin-[acetyl-CoA-carboxylase] ligase
MIDFQAIQRGFRTVVIKPRLIVLDTIDSTNSLAKGLLSRAGDEDVIVVAESQQSGRGRYNRHWHSPFGGLYMSVAMRPHLEEGNVALLGILTGCAVVSAIHGMTKLDARLKWPNDIMLNGLKAGGVLSEFVTMRDNSFGVILGIGINQNMNSKDLPTEFRDHATTILTELGTETSREELAYHIVNEIDRRLAVVYSELSFSSVLDEWMELNETIGETVMVDDGTQIVRGVATGITSAGSLRVRVGSSEVEIRAGDVIHI